MSTLSVLNKYLGRHLSALRGTATPGNPIFEQIEHFKSLAELAQPNIKRLDVDGFEIAVIMDTTVMHYDSEKHPSNMGELFGSGSYIIRRKEDNQVISGYLRDVARLDTQSRNPYGNHYEISKSQFDAVN